MARFGKWKDPETGLIMEGDVPFEFWPEDAKRQELRWGWLRWALWLTAIAAYLVGWSRTYG